MNATIALEIPGNQGEEKQKKIIAQFLEAYRSSEGNLLALESGVKAQSLNNSPVDTKLFEVEKITRTRVATVYNIPPHLLGDYSDASFSSMEQQMMEFLELTMLPIVQMYEQELNRKLLTRRERMEGMGFAFDMDSLMRGDTATRAEYSFKMVRSGVLKPNEIREKEGKAPDKNGEQLLVSRDLIPLDVTVNQTEKLMRARK